MGIAAIIESTCFQLLCFEIERVSCITLKYCNSLVGIGDA